MDKHKNKSLEDVMKEKFLNLELNDDSNLWNKISDKLPEKKETKVRSLYRTNYYLVAAAITAILVITGLIYFTSNRDTEQDIIVVDKTKQLIKESPVIKEPNKIQETVKEEVLVKEEVHQPKKSAEKVVIAYSTDGEKKVVTLPDSSTVHLNKNSRLVLTTFNEATRELTLTGEAFFQVKKKNGIPFKVTCRGSVTEVLGTSFNIRQVNVDSVELFVEEGKVKFYSASQPFSSGIFVANEYGICTGTKVVKEAVKSLNYNTWRTGMVRFENAPLATVIHDIERHFNLRIIVSDPSILNCHISGTFRNATPEKIMNVISRSLNIDTEKKDNQYFLKGEGCK